MDASVNERRRVVYEPKKIRKFNNLQDAGGNPCKERSVSIIGQSMDRQPLELRPSGKAALIRSLAEHVQGSRAVRHEHMYRNLRPLFSAHLHRKHRNRSAIYAINRKSSVRLNSAASTKVVEQQLTDALFVARELRLEVSDVTESDDVRVPAT